MYFQMKRRNSIDHADRGLKHTYIYIRSLVVVISWFNTIGLVVYGYAVGSSERVLFIMRTVYRYATSY
jgi:hypothetical protein